MSSGANTGNGKFVLTPLYIDRIDSLSISNRVEIFDKSIPFNIRGNKKIGIFNGNIDDTTIKYNLKITNEIDLRVITNTDIQTIMINPKTFEYETNTSNMITSEKTDNIFSVSIETADIIDDMTFYKYTFLIWDDSEKYVSVRR